MGPIPLRHVGSSQTRDRTHVLCTGRQILNHCATREVLVYLFKEPALNFIDIFYCLFTLFHLFVLWSVISFLLLTLGLICSSFSSSLRCIVRLFIWNFFLFVSWCRRLLLCTSLLELLILHPTSFSMLCFHFYLSQGIFWFIFCFLHWPICCLVADCLIIHIFVIFFTLFL